MEDETFDYGLDPGESFDPDDDQLIDRSGPHIMTVLGPIDPGALGPVNLAASFVPRTPEADLGEILTEIQECAVVGLNALVDIRPISSEAEARAALWLAERCDIHLIVAAGVEPALGPGRNAARLIEQAGNGLYGAPVLPGLIVADPASTAAGLSAREATGLPLLVDARNGGAERVPPEADLRVVVRGDALAAVTPPKLLVDLDGQARVPAPQQILDDHRLLFGYDPPVKRPELFSRWSWLIEEFPIALLERGLNPHQVRALLVDAPADFLTIEPPALPRC